MADPLGNTAYFGYDAAGNRRKVTTPLQETSYFAYDALNRLIGTTDPLNESASFGYDSVGNRVKVCDALSNTTYYRYDALNRQTATLDALGDSEYFAYDAASNLLKHRDALANSTYYRYNVLNRRTKVSYPDTTYAYFRYDAVSNLTGAKDAWGWTYFSYDALNRITQEMRLLGNSVSHSYDALGNRLKLSIGDGEPAQYFRYDALGRMTAAASTAVGSGGYGNQAWGITFYGGAGSIPGSGTAYYAYDAASRRTKTLLGNGAAAYFSYDAANRLLSQKSILPGGTALTYFNYGYDAASRIVKIGREGGKTIYYSYDGADRLTGENWYNGGMQNVYAFAWSYDAVGNRRWQNRLGQQSYFTYDAANALRKSFPVGGSATYYSYDLNGNCTKIAAPASQTTYFAYNSVNLMTQVTFRNGVFELLLLRRPEPQARAPRQQRPGVLHVRQGWPLPAGRAQHHGNCPRRIYPRLRAGPRHRRHGRREDQHPDHELLPVPRLRPTWQRPKDPQRRRRGHRQLRVQRLGRVTPQPSPDRRNAIQLQRSGVGDAQR